MRNATLGRTVCFVAVLATVAGCVRLRAQDGVFLEPGTRVRVFTPLVGSGGLIGIVVGLVRDTRFGL